LGKITLKFRIERDTKFTNFMIVSCSFAKITEIAILIMIFCNHAHHTNFTYIEFPPLLYLIATYQHSSSDGFTTFLKIAAFSNLYVFLVPK